MAELQCVRTSPGGVVAKVKKLPLQKTLILPVPTGKGLVLHQNLFPGHKTGQAEGS